PHRPPSPHFRERYPFPRALPVYGQRSRFWVALAVGRRMPRSVGGCRRSRSVDAVLAQQAAQACGGRRGGGIPPGDRSHPRLPAQALLAPLLIEQHLLERAAIAVPLVEVLHLAVELADHTETRPPEVDVHPSVTVPELVLQLGSRQPGLRDRHATER